MKIKRPKSIQNLTQNSIKISLRKTAMQAAMPNLAQEHKTEPLVPTCWTSLIATLRSSLIEKLNQLPSSQCLTKISTLVEITTTAHLTPMITVANLEASIALLVTKAQPKTIHQSLAKLQLVTKIKTALPSKLKLSMLHASTQRVLSSCQPKLLLLPQKWMTSPNRTLFSSTSQKEDGSALSVKITTSKEEKTATDAKRTSLMKTTKESQSTWVKLNWLRSKRKLSKLKKRPLLNKTNKAN